MKEAIAIVGIVVLLVVPTVQAKPLLPGCRLYCPTAVTPLCPPARCPARHCLLAELRCFARTLKRLRRRCRKDPSVCPPPTTTTTTTQPP
jgi:hypothetical protein